MNTRDGDLYNVKPEAWARFCAETGTTSAWNRPQPLVDIDPISGWLMLAFPHHWWDPDDLEGV